MFKNNELNSFSDMNKILYFLTIFFAGYFLWGCRQAVDHEALKTELLHLHKTLIDAHQNRDIDFFTLDLADDYWQVSNGDINYPEKSEIRDRFTSYLINTTFTEYRDIEEPIIKISADGSMAWIIVKVKIAGTRTMEDDTERKLDFTCAWITLYNRENDRWIRQGEVSTFR